MPNLFCDLTLNMIATTFVAMCLFMVRLPETYVRFIENALRAEFALGGVPVRFVQRTGDRTYRRKRSKAVARKRK